MAGGLRLQRELWRINEAFALISPASRSAQIQGYAAGDPAPQAALSADDRKLVEGILADVAKLE